MTNYSTDGSTVQPITIKNSLISSLEEARYIMSNKYLIETPSSVDLDFDIKNTIIDIDVTGEDNLFLFAHDGTLNFNDGTHFKSVDALVVELDTYAPNCTVGFENCKATNVSFTRTGVAVDINDYQE